MSIPLTESQIILECILNQNSQDVDPNCVCLLSGGGPAMNTDISGIGVRISFYLQALFLACLSARSGSLDEITGALYTLVATNVAMAVTSFILGFKAQPEISLHDALVVFYLLALSWASVFFSLPSYNRFVKSDKTLKYLSVLQSYVLFAFALAILIKAETFGMTPLCNSHAVAVIFRPISALHTGRIAAWVVVTITIIVYTSLTVSDYKPLVSRWIKNMKKQRKEKREAAAAPSAPGTIPRDLNAAEAGVMSSELTRTRHPTTVESDTEEKEENKTKKTNKNKNKNKDKNGKKNQRKQHAADNQYDLGISGNLIIEIIVIFILWALTVMNTELLILWNNFDGGGGGDSSWQFGQILPMFLIVIPLVNMVKAFLKYKFQRRTHRRRVHKKHATRHGVQHGGTRSGFGFDDGPSPFSGFGGGLGGMPFMPFFSGSPFQTARPDGNIPTARISEHSIHTVHSRKSMSSSKDGSDPDTESQDPSFSSPSHSPGGRLSPAKGGQHDLEDSYQDVDDEHTDSSNSS